jgi:exopolysaccharide production protein ExoQ
MVDVFVEEPRTAPLAPRAPSPTRNLADLGAEHAPGILGVLGILLLSNYPFYWLTVERPAFDGAFRWRIPLLIFGSVFVIARADPQRLRRTLIRAWPVLAWMGFAFASLFWTVDTSMTTWSLVEPITGFTFCLALAVTFPQRRLLDVVAIAGVILLLFNFYACIQSPEITAIGGPWGGLTGNRNGLGMNTVIFVPFMFFAMGGKFSLKRAWRYPLFLFGLGLAAYVMYRTGSKTSTGAIIAAGWIFGMSILGRTTARFDGSLKALIRAIGFLIVSALTGLVTKALANTGYFAFSSTFSMRTPIWREAITITRDNMRTGVGYAGWASGKGYFKQATWDRGVDQLSHLHNAYIQQFMDLGIVGLVLMIVALLVLGWRWARVATSKFPFGAGFGIVLWLCLVIIYGFESRGLWPTFDLMWPMLCLLAVLPPPKLRSTAKIAWTPNQQKIGKIGIGLAAVLGLAIPLTARRAYVAESAMGRVMAAQSTERGLKLSADEFDTLQWIGWYAKDRPDLQNSYVVDGVPDTEEFLKWAALHGDTQSQTLDLGVLARFLERWRASAPTPVGLGDQVVDGVAVADVTEPVVGLTEEIPEPTDSIVIDTLPSDSGTVAGLPQ